MNDSITAGTNGLSRRTFLGASAVAGVSVAVLGLNGCAPAQPSNNVKYEPGTYTGEADGKFDTITVEMDFSEDAITDVRIVNSNDTARICDPALEMIPQRIMDAQGLGVDTVTGATLTSMGIINACAKAAEQAGASTSKLMKVGSPEPSTEVVDVDTDVVVVGGGASGMGCAIACAQTGAKVTVLEKNSNIGGNCLVSGGYLEYVTAPDKARPEMTDALHRYVKNVLESDIAKEQTPEILETAKKKYDEYLASGSKKLFDCQEFYALDYAVTTGEGLPVEVYLPVYADIAVLNDWMTDLGFDWSTPTFPITGYLYPRWSNPTTGVCGEGYFNFFDGILDGGKMDVEVLLATPATELIMDGKKVVGVKAVAEDGTTYNVKASKVVFASGGFSGNPDLLREFDESWNYPEGEILCTNVNGHTGDAITLTRDLKVSLGDMANQMIFPFNDPLTISAENVCGSFADSPIVNKQGKRFLDETTDRFTMTAALMEQEDSLCYMISDANNVIITDASPGEETLLRRGQLFKADTLEELAEQIGMDPATFAEEMDRYNGFVEAGDDKDFGRYLFTDISSVKTPPFYAAPATWAAHITIGGINTDEHYNAITEDGKAIEGLYICGEARNGICGVSSIADGVAAGKAMFA